MGLTNRLIEGSIAATNAAQPFNPSAGGMTAAAAPMGPGTMAAKAGPMVSATPIGNPLPVPVVSGNHRNMGSVAGHANIGPFSADFANMPGLLFVGHPAAMGKAAMDAVGNAPASAVMPWAMAPIWPGVLT